MKSIKPGRGPSMMNAVGSLIGIVFGIIWTCAAASMGAPGFFPLFGLVFIGIGVVNAIYSFKNATGDNRYSAYDIVDEDEERWDGSLELAGGALNRDAGEAACVVAEMSGTITDPSSIDHEVNGRLEGDFSGSDGEFVSGDVIGESCAADCETFEGSFIVKD